MEPICCSSKIFWLQNLTIGALLLPFLRISRTWAVEGNVALATTFEAGLEVAIRTVARRVTSLRKKV